MSSAPPLSLVEKYILAKLALGDELKSEVSFFDGLKPTNDYSSQNSKVIQLVHLNDILRNSSIISYLDSCDVKNDIDNNITLLKANLSRNHDLLLRTTVTNKYLSQINRQLSKITSDQQALNFLIESNSLFRKRKGGLTKVQLTSISRRRNGVSRGCKRLNSGRPSLSKNKKK